MKKKLLIAITALLGLLAIPTAVYAYEVTLRGTVNIYTVSGQEGNSITVSTFDDRGNKCYIVRSGQPASYGTDQANISCVRMD